MLISDMFTDRWRTLRRRYSVHQDDIWRFAILCILFKPDDISISDIICASWHLSAAGNDFELVHRAAQMPKILPHCIDSCPDSSSHWKYTDIPSHAKAFFDLIRHLSLCNAEDGTGLSDMQFNQWIKPYLNAYENTWFLTLKSLLSLNSVGRAGWFQMFASDHHIPPRNIENVADHSIKTAFLAAMLANNDKETAFLLGLCHDWAELYVGDITPRDNVSPKDKHQMESLAYQRIIDQLPIIESRKASVRFLLDGYDAGIHTAQDDGNATALCVRTADKLDALIQALFYASLYHVDLTGFESHMIDEMMAVNTRGI